MKYTALTIPGSSPHVINSTQTPNLHTLLPRFETLLSPTAPRLHHQATTPELLGYRTSHSLLDNDSRAVPVSDPLANHPTTCGTLRKLVHQRLAWARYTRKVLENHRFQTAIT